MEKATLSFLKQLTRNNNKPWFDKNRKAYENAREDFADLVQKVINLHAKKDSSITNLMAKDCMFRINRDVRFSNDKSPYKTNFGASINSAGKKAWNNAGYYIHCEPGKSFAGGGIYMPESALLKKIRQEIDYNYDEFKKLLTARKFKSTFVDLDRSPDISLSRFPKGYETDNPAAEYLKLKSYIAMVDLPDKLILTPNAEKRIATAFEALQPVIDFLNKAVS